MPTVDTRADLDRAMSLAAKPDQIDRTLAAALDALAAVIPYDLATIMEFCGKDELKPRLCRGALARPELSKLRLRLEQFPSVRELIDKQKARAFTEDDHRYGDGDIFEEALGLPHGHSCMVVPLFVEDESLGLMTLDRTVCSAYPPDVVKLGLVYGRLIALAITFGEQSSLLRRVYLQTSEQNRILRDKVPGSSGQVVELCRSPAMQKVINLARQVAVTDTPVLITGETGTGKEVLATAIHAWSQRQERPMVTVNCAALPANLIESELFGHKKGAFSGASDQRLGRFQVANGGTLFLDEIGDLPLEVQAKLLRVLQEGTFEPVGSDTSVRVDVRIVAATHVQLDKAVEGGRFREDIFYRLNVFPIEVPPLRKRPEDIPVLAEQFLAQLHRTTGRGPWSLSSSDLGSLVSRPWPGNVRELLNFLERATIMSPEPGSIELPTESAPTATPIDRDEGAFPTLEEMERAHFTRALERTGGKLYGKDGAARLLGLNPSTAKSRMVKLGLGGARDHRSRSRNAISRDR